MLTKRQKILTVSYGAVAAIAWLAGFYAKGFSGVLWIWVAAVYTYVSVAHVRHNGYAIMGKHKGKISFLSRFVMLPFWIPCWISQEYQKRLNPKCSEKIGLDLYVRQIPEKFEQPSIDMCAEFDAPVLTSDYYNICTIDLLGVRPAVLEKAVECIAQLRKVHSEVYINCALGKGRSVAVAIAWLLASKQCATIEQAFSLIKSSRPCAVLPDETHYYLTEWMNGRKH